MTSGARGPGADTDPARDRDVPQRRASDGDAPPPSVPPSPVALDVLLVEEDPSADTDLEEILVARGHRVESVEAGGEVPRRFRDGGHPLVFLDLDLPDPGGIEVCRTIRAMPESRHTMILFVTGAGAASSLDDALEAGADDYVVKPATPRLLHTRIAIAERRVQELHEHRQREEELLQEAYRDGLTGLGSRDMLEDRVEQSLGRLRRSGRPLFAVLLADLDGFHAINERYGPDFADGVLREVGRRIDESVRDVDTATRIAADQFGVHLEDLKSESDPTRVAGRIQDALSSPVEVDGRRVAVSACMGIALVSKPRESTEDVLRDATKAVNRAKARGRGEVQIYDPAVHARAMARVALEDEIREAIERDELALHYQPILELRSGRIESVEALLRWDRPDGGLRLPSTFIPVAEESGLIVPLGWWTLATACRQARLWSEGRPQAPPLHISVNVSSRQFLQPDVHEIVARTLDEAELPGDSLHLELTETSLMEDADGAIRRLQKLGELGVSLHVDDFGTGYSSLAYLCRLPIDTVKIDRAFVHAMTESREHLEVVRTIIHLARNLDLDVVAEGVETESQESLLRELDCDFVQGYRYYRPMGSDDVAALLDGAA